MNFIKRSETYKKGLRYLIFGIVCGIAILPSLIIGYFQTLHFTQEKFELFGQHLESIVLSAQKKELTPNAALNILHVHELVLWSRYLKNEIVMGQSGNFLNRSQQRVIIKKTISPDIALKKQLPIPDSFFNNESHIYILEIPIQTELNNKVVLEVGIWFEPLANLQKNGLALSLVLFLTAMIFLVGVYIFIDNYLLTLFEKVSKGLNLEKEKNIEELSKTDMPFFSPSIRNLLNALKEHTNVLNDERTARATMETFITELNRQLEQQRLKLEEAHRQLLQSSKLAAIGELAGGVAHEVNNPNGIILAGAKYLKDKLKRETPDLPPYVDSYLDRIIRQSTRISEIVNALLTFSRRRPKEKLSMQIYDCVLEAHELTAHRLNQITCENRIQPHGPQVLGNKNEMVQVFLNLLSNAIDAMPNGGHIEVWSETKKNKNGLVYLKISIHNTGDDIPEEVLDKMMEPFFTTKGVGKGTGLGLSISLGIIQEHGGTMTVKNHPQGGALFEITLPTISTPKD